MKIYTKKYSEHYASLAKALAPLKVTAHKMTCFQIPFPSEGILEQVTVSQVSTDGTAAGATVELLNSSLPYPPGDYTPGASAADKIDHYRVMPTMTFTAGNAGTLNEEDFGRGFRNVDGGWTLNQRFLYLLINPGDVASDTHWNVTLGCRTDIC